MTAPNRKLRDHRHRAGLTQEELASRVGVSVLTARRWETEGRQPHGPIRRRVCHVLEATPEELGLGPTGLDRRAELDGDPRLPLGRHAPGTLSQAPEPWQRLLKALERPRRLDPSILDHLDRVTRALSRLEREVTDPAALIDPVLGHLEGLSRFLEGSPSPPERRVLSSLAAETAGVAGWLVWDQRGPDAAELYFRTGLLAAREAGDAALGAYLAGSLAYRPIYGEDPATRLLLLRDPPYGFTADHASPHTGAWLATMEASAHARAGDHEGYDRASDRARALLAVPYDDGRERPRVPFFDATYLAEEEATALGQLGRGEEARAVVEDALPRARGRFVPWLLLDLAYAFARDRQPDAAADTGCRALSEASGTHMRSVVGALRPLVAELAEHRQLAAVRELEEQLRSTGP